MNRRLLPLRAAAVALLVAAITPCGASVAGSDSEVPSVRVDHPRLGFRPEGTPGERTFAVVRDLYRNNETFRGYFLRTVEMAETELQEPEDPLLHAACWVATGDDKFAAAAVRALDESRLKTTADSSYYSPVWQFALAYDWLFNHPAMTDDLKHRIEARIADVLESELRDLDGAYSVVWHGRTQLANNALVTALSLSLDPRASGFQRRALDHYADAMRALALSEGWPEGTSYWIYNRAFPFGLASDCFITATGETKIEGVDVREVIRRTALWQLYSLRPDLAFARYGDCWNDGLTAGPGLWQPVVDYYARITRDPAVAAASDFFRANSRRLYHAGRYGWSAVLAYDPALPMPEDYDRRAPGRYLSAHLPHTAIFGRHSLGEAFLTNGWGAPQSTWLSFKAGDAMAHHGHYDQGTFSIYCGAPLAVNSGQYADYFGDYRLGYFVQTVAKNSLLIHAPGEFGNFSHAAGNFDAITGGQRVVMPSGSHIVSVNDWLLNLHRGTHYAASDILAFESRPGEFDYLSTDLTDAYNSTRYAEPGNPAKVSSVTRKFLYLRKPGAVVVLDRVITTDPGYRTQWLLHTPAKPEAESARQVEGEPEDGILATEDRSLESSYGAGRLIHQMLLPEQAETLLIGGPSYRHYMETASGGASPEPSGRRRDEPDEWGTWRVQICDAAPRQEHLFLNVLWPRLAEEETPPPARLISSDQYMLVLSVADHVVVFSVDGRLGPTITYQAPTGAGKHLILDLSGRSTWEVSGPQGTSRIIASADGVLAFNAGEGEMKLARRYDGGSGGYQ